MVGGKASVPVQEVQVRRCVFLGASVWTERQSVLQDDNELVNFAAATSPLLQDDAERAPIPIFCAAFGCVARFH